MKSIQHSNDHHIRDAMQTDLIEGCSNAPLVSDLEADGLGG